MTKSVIVDVMGADLGPDFAISACIRFANNYPQSELILVGDKKCIYENSVDLPSNIKVIHANDVVNMQTVPQSIIRNPADYSMSKALHLAKDLQIPCITAGNTGALVLLAQKILGFQKDIKYSALAVEFPTKSGFCLLLDAGANVDVKPEAFLHFAKLGKSLAAQKNVLNPKIALLNIGIEDYKGNRQIKQAAKFLQQNQVINYIGFIESKDVYAGAADIVLCDGFVGNLFLKTSEAVVEFLDAKNKYNINMNKRAFLLGVNGKVIKAHGSSNTDDFYSCL